MLWAHPPHKNTCVSPNPSSCFWAPLPYWWCFVTPPTLLMDVPVFGWPPSALNHPKGLSLHTLKNFNIRVTVYKGVIPPWMKWNSSFNDNYFRNFLLVTNSHSEKWLSKGQTRGSRLLRGHPHMNETNTILLWWLLSHFPAVWPIRFLKRHFARI